MSLAQGLGSKDVPRPNYAEVRFGDGFHGAIPVANVANPGANVVATNLSAAARADRAGRDAGREAAHRRIRRQRAGVALAARRIGDRQLYRRHLLGAIAHLAKADRRIGCNAGPVVHHHTALVQVEVAARGQRRRVLLAVGVGRAQLGGVVPQRPLAGPQPAALDVGFLAVGPNLKATGAAVIARSSLVNPS